MATRNPDISAPRERMPRALWLTVLGLTAWLVVPWAAILFTSLEGAYLWAILVLFTLVSFGTATICVLRSVHTHRARGGGKLFEGRLSVLTGTLPMRAAIYQLLLIPGAVAVGFTLIALVDVIQRR